MKLKVLKLHNGEWAVFTETGALVSRPHRSMPEAFTRAVKVAENPVVMEMLSKLDAGLPINVIKAVI